MASKISQADYLNLIKQAYNDVYGHEDIVFSEPPETTAEKKRLRNLAKRNIVDFSKAKQETVFEQAGTATWMTINAFVVQVFASDGNLFSLSISEEKGKIHRKIDPNKDLRFEFAEWREFFQGKMAVRMPLEQVADMVRYLQAISKVISFC